MDAVEVSAARITRPHTAARLWLPALLLAALLLRVVPWLANLPLHHDEALYGTWAHSIADGSDPFLLIPWVDKPPLVLYLLAGSIRLFGASEISLRLPGMVAGVLTVWATFGLARRVVGTRGAWVAAVLMALSPFAILFSPTAFTDGWLTLFVVAAAWAALARRPLWAGVLLGLACASKQQGVFGALLVVALIVLTCLPNRPDRSQGDAVARPVRSTLAALALAVLGFAVVFGGVTWWDSLRWHNRPSYWDQSLQTYGGVVLAPLALWPERALAWARQAGYWFGAWPITAVVLVAAGARPSTNKRMAAADARTRMNEWRRTPAATIRSFVSDSLIRGWPRPALACFVYLLGYLLVHLAFTFQPWDRYLLPILPLVCILCGQGLVALWDRASAQPAVRRWAAGGAVAALTYAAALGVTSSVPVGSDIGAYRGVAQAAQFLATQPAGTTVYYDRIGWHLGYYLYGHPVTRSWYDSPQKLASETVRVAGESGGAAQWLALPTWEDAQLATLQDALAADGFTAVPAYEVTGRTGTVDLTLYRLERGTRAVESGRGNAKAGENAKDEGQNEPKPQG